MSDAIAATRDVSAVASLLANDSAQIREETLDLILDAAPSHESWHEPLVHRPNLPGKAAKRIAGFVAASLLKLLSERKDLPADALAEVRQVMERRLDVKLEAEEEAVEKDEQESHTPMAEAEAKVKKLIKDRKLDNDAVQEAIERNDRNFVLQALVQNGAADTLLAELGAGRLPALAASIDAALQDGRTRQDRADLPGPRGGTAWQLTLIAYGDGHTSSNGSAHPRA